MNCSLKRFRNKQYDVKIWFVGQGGKRMRRQSDDKQGGQNVNKKEKRKKKVIVAVSILFYSGMLVLALGARRQHEGSLPQVTVTVPRIKIFGEGELMSAASALPEKIAGSGTLFLVSEEMINGELRMIAREVAELELGRVSDGYREIVSGVSAFSKVIVDGKERLRDGDEVLVKGEWMDDGK